jgi:hypothetical protein
LINTETECICSAAKDLFQENNKQLPKRSVNYNDGIHRRKYGKGQVPLLA